jgi:hypothetical protein
MISFLAVETQKALMQLLTDLIGEDEVPQFLRLAEGYLQELPCCLFLAIFTSEGLSSLVMGHFSSGFCLCQTKTH